MISVALLPSAHSNIKSCASISIVGAVVSSKVIVDVQLFIFPHASAVLNVTVYTPVNPHDATNSAS